MKAEPHFLLESTSRRDFGWRLSQTDGAILLPVPQDFHTTTEAISHVKRLSKDLGCTLKVRVSHGPHEGPRGDRVFEIHHPAATSTAKFSNP